MVGFGPNCDVADVNTVGIKGEGAGSEGGDPGDGPGARDFYNCLRRTELECVRWLNGCIADEMRNYADAMSLQTSRGANAEDAWTEQAHNIGFVNYLDQDKTRYVSRINPTNKLYGVVAFPKYNHPNTAFIYHAAAKSACMARLQCNFSKCYCNHKDCARCEEDGYFVLPKPNTGGNPGDSDTGEKTFRDNTITTDAKAVTTSSYGTVIPVVFGVGRVKGNVIWAGGATAHSVTFNTEIDDAVVTETVDYVTVNLAVSVCAGSIGAIGRIWLGDRVIYSGLFSAEGASKNATIDYDPREIGLENENANLNFPFRVTVYRGTEDQRPHPLVSGDELPIAYRGQAYVVFENLAIIGAGGIPDFTFEVVQTVDTNFEPIDTADFSEVPFDGAAAHVLAADRANNAMLVVGNPKAPLSRSSVVKLDNDTLRPVNTLLPDVDAFNGETLYAVDPSTVSMSEDGAVFFNTTGSDTWQKTYIFDSGPERGRRAFGSNSMTPPTGDYLRALDGDGYLSAFGLIADGDAFPTKMAFFATGTLLEILRYDLDMQDYEVIKRTTFAGPIAAVRVHEAHFDTEIRRYLYVFYWTGSGLARTLTARVYLLQATTEVQTYGFNPLNMRYTEYAVSKSAWAGDDSAEIVSIAADNRDGYMIITMRGTTGYVFKWLDGALPWTAAHAALPTLTAKRSPMSASVAGLYRWIDAAQVYTLDFTTGAISSAAHGQTVTSLGAQYYDHSTDSIVFIDNKAVKRYYVNRIRKGQTRLGTVLEDLFERAGVPVPFGKYASLDQIVHGYVITQPASARVVLEQLALLYGFAVTGDGEIIDNTEVRVTYVIDTETLLQTTNGRVNVALVDDYDRYSKVIVQYYDVDQLYAVKSVMFDRASIEFVDTVRGEDALTYDFPVAMSEGDALQFAERMMYRAVAMKAKAKIVVPPASFLSATDFVKVDGVLYRVKGSTYETGKGTELELVADVNGFDRGVPAIPGTTLPVVDDDVVVSTGSVNVQLINVPSVSPAAALGEPVLSASFLIALTATPSAPVTIEYFDAYNPNNIGSVTLSKKPVSGRLASALGPIGDDMSIDKVTTFDVVFDTAPDQSLFDGDAFRGFGERLLIVGTELIKFNAVTWSVDGRTATFSMLLRGRRNTDLYAANHFVGEQVLLYEEGAIGDGFIPTSYENMGLTRVITMRQGARLRRTWTGRLRSDVIIPPILWRNDLTDILGQRLAMITVVPRYWNDNLFEDDRGDVLTYATRATLSPQPRAGVILIYHLRAPYDDALFRANFVTSALAYEEFPSNPYIAAVYVPGFGQTVASMDALPPYYCCMAVIGPYEFLATAQPQGMVSYGAFGNSGVYSRETLTTPDSKYPMRGYVPVDIDGYSRPF